MYFHAIGRHRYRVHKDKDDKRFYGVVEKEEYVSVNPITGGRTVKRFWKVYNAGGGWRAAPKQTFSSRDAAGRFLLQDAAVPYADKETHWTKRQDEGRLPKAA